MQGIGFRVYGLGFKVLGFKGLGFKGLGFRVKGILVFRCLGLGFRREGIYIYIYIYRKKRGIQEYTDLHTIFKGVSPRFLGF